MGIGYFQLTVISENDKYLVGNPQFTYFKALYKRHTNFAMETSLLNFVGETSMGYGASSNFGKKVYTTIPKNGDLLHRMYLVLDTQWNSNGEGDIGNCPNGNPPLSDMYSKLTVDAQGLIDYIQIQIGDQIIDKHTGEWLHIYNETILDSSAQNMLCDMIHLHNNVNPNNVDKPALKDGLIYIPLLFWFNRNPGLALPLLALQYSDIKIDVKFHNKEKITNANDSGNFRICNVQLLAEYIHLGKDEKNLFAQNSHEYLIEQVQYCNNINIPLKTDKYPSKEVCNGNGELLNVGDYEFSKYQHKFELPFNHPVKMLFWFIQDNSSNLNYPGDGTIQESYLDIDNSKLSRNYNGNNIFNYWFNLDWDNRINQLIDATIAVNGNEIFEPIGANYFNSVLKYQYFENNGYSNLESVYGTDQTLKAVNVSYNKGSGIYCYSFALHPADHQPSGTLNFSKLDKAELRLRVRRDSNNIACNCEVVDGSIGTLTQKTLKVYAVNYNVLRIMSGRAGLAFSN